MVEAMERDITDRPARERSPAVPHRTVAERVAMGKQARATVPRSAHASWAPPTDRRDPIDVLEAQASTRVPDLVPIRYGRMIASPFAFYRGAAAIMAADLAATPSSGLRAQLCGDAHLSNFGLFGSPERSLVFDINDFDETLPGPWEWDLKRLCASLAVAGRGNGFSPTDRRRIVLSAAASYRTAMREFAAVRELEVWYARASAQEGLPRLRALLDKKNMKEAENVVRRAHEHDSLQAFDKLTRIVDGQRRIVSTPPLVVRVEDLLPTADAAELQTTMHELLRLYRRSLPLDRRHLLEQFRYVDLARKVVGVGSVGTRAWIMLLVGRDHEDPLFLQAKEAEASVLEPYAGASRFATHGQRVVEGQRLMQASSDIFLGWERVNGADGVRRDFYLRQLRDWKGSWEPERMDQRAMTVYGQVCSWTLARAHARSGDRIAIAAYCGNSDSLDRAIADFSEAYADQNERDHAAAVAAVKAGRIAATKE